MFSLLKQLWLVTPTWLHSLKICCCCAALLTCKLWDIYPDTQQGHTSSLGPKLGLGMSPMLPIQPHPEGALCSQASSQLTLNHREQSSAG